MEGAEMGFVENEIGSARWLGAAIAAALWTGGCSLERQPYPGPGPSTSSTTSVETPCVEDETCADTDGNPCTSPVCLEGLCAEQVDDTVILQPDSECATYSCSGGAKQETFADVGQGCGADPKKTHCNGRGKCAGCQEPKDCGEDTDCRTWACVEEECEPTNTAEGPLADGKQTKGDCATRACDGNGNEVELTDANDEPDDDDVCHEGACDGMTPMQVVAEGKECGDPGTCVDFVEKAPDTCDQDGVCQPGAMSACPPFACDAANQQCAESCTPATEAQDCVNAYCEGSTCAATKDNGAPCGAAGECIGGFCVDGVCCINACNTACSSCDLGGGMPGVCAPLPKGVVDTCLANQACNSGGCVSLAGKKAVGQVCSQNSDCFNDNGASACLNGLCRLTLNVACEPATFWYCTTKFCDSMTGVCAECAADADCQGGTCDMGGSVNRCKLGANAPCGADADCASNDCDLAAGSPGTCQ